MLVAVPEGLADGGFVEGPQANPGGHQPVGHIDSALAWGAPKAGAQSQERRRRRVVTLERTELTAVKPMDTYRRRPGAVRRRAAVATVARREETSTVAAALSYLPAAARLLTVH